jgi:hypothetical protein
MSHSDACYNRTVLIVVDLKDKVILLARKKPRGVYDPIGNATE